MMEMNPTEHADHVSNHSKQKTHSSHSKTSNSKSNVLEIQHDQPQQMQMQAMVYNNGMSDGGQGQQQQNSLNYKIPQIKGEKTIICWNCNTVLLIKEEWNVVQCTNCEKINRVPNAHLDANKQIKINDNLNHFELYLPYVYIIVTCPFCKTDNKARKDAEHMVCYKCHNSISIQKENKTDYSQQQSGGSNNFMLPNKSMRFSDMFFNDPMFYPGYYPMNNFNPYQQPHYDPYSYYNNDLDYLYKKKVKYDIMKNKLKTENYREKVKSSPLSDKYKAIKGLLDHHDMMISNRKGGVNSSVTDTRPNAADNFISNNFSSSFGNNNNHIPTNNSSSSSNTRTPNKERGDAVYKSMFTNK